MGGLNPHVFNPFVLVALGAWVVLDGLLLVTSVPFPPWFFLLLGLSPASRSCRRGSM